MKLGFFTAILPDLSLQQVLEFAARNEFAAIEVACWPAGKAERKFAGVTHIDVAGFSQTQCDDIKALCSKYGVGMSALVIIRIRSIRIRPFQATQWSI